MTHHGLPGVFIVFEGPDAAGKTTQIPLLKEQLEARGLSVMTTREPGGTPFGEKVREIVLSTPSCLAAETLLFAASRAEHVEGRIKPALAAGYIVLCDRYMMSTYAYQGAGRGFKEHLKQLDLIAHNNFFPDFTLFFDVPFEVSRERMLGRVGKQDRFDLEADAFVKRVYEGYHEALRINLVPNVQVIDANYPVEIVAQWVKDWMDTVFLPWYETRV